jgi:N-acetylmuramoyl-L-alanine amidase
MSPLPFTDRPSPNYDARTRPVDLVVLHYTGMQDAEIALKRLTDAAPIAGNYPGPWQRDEIDKTAPLPKVSAHYVVDEAGKIYRVVAEEHRAWHAGASSWEKEGDVNSRAIGIEIVNGGHDFGLPDFPPAQIEAVIALLDDILERWALTPARVVAHSDIAPDRKLDPGEKFPWRKLAEAGVSIWPNSAVHPPPQDEAEPVVALQERLMVLGYDLDASGVSDARTKYAIAAFQRRFRPRHVDGVADVETSALIAALSLAHS